MLKKIFGFFFLKKLKIESTEKPTLVFFDEYSSHVVDGKFLTTKEYKNYLINKANGKAN